MLTEFGNVTTNSLTSELPKQYRFGALIYKQFSVKDYWLSQKLPRPQVLSKWVENVQRFPLPIRFGQSSNDAGNLTNRKFAMLVKDKN